MDPESRSIEVLVLEGSDYASSGLFRVGDTLGCQLLPGFEVELAQVFPARA